jgi:hypothetical protein
MDGRVKRVTTGPGLGCWAAVSPYSCRPMSTPVLPRTKYAAGRNYPCPRCAERRRLWLTISNIQSASAEWIYLCRECIVARTTCRPAAATGGRAILSSSG